MTPEEIRNTRLNQSPVVAQALFVRELAAQVAELVVVVGRGINTLEKSNDVSKSLIELLSDDSTRLDLLPLDDPDDNKPVTIIAPGEAAQTISTLVAGFSAALYHVPENTASSDEWISAACNLIEEKNLA